MYIIGITGPSGAGKTTALRVLEELGGEVYDCDAVYHEMLASDGELLGRIEAAFPGAVRDYVLDRKALGARVFADPDGLQRLTDITQPLVKQRVLERIRSGGRPSRGPAAEPSPPRHSERSAAESKNPPPTSASPAASAASGPEPGGTGPSAALRTTGSEHVRISPSPAPGRETRPLQPAVSCSPSSVPCSPSSAPAACCLLPAAPFAVIDAIGLFESGLGEACDLTVAVIADPEVRVRRLMARDGITEEYARARIAAQKPAEWFAGRADLVLENNGTEEEFAQICRDVFVQKLRIPL